MMMFIIIIGSLADSTESTVPILKNTHKEARKTLNNVPLSSNLRVIV